MLAIFVWHLVLSKSQVVDYQFHKVADMPLSTLREEMYAFINSCMYVCVYTYVRIIKYSTIVRNNTDQPKNNGAHNLCTSKTHVRIQITWKSHLKCIVTTIIAFYLSENKFLVFRPVYNFKNLFILASCIPITLGKLYSLGATRYQSLFLPVVLIRWSWQYFNLLGHNLISVLFLTSQIQL